MGLFLVLFFIIKDLKNRNNDFNLIFYKIDTIYIDIIYDQTMTEAAFFTIGRSRIIGYGRILPLADYWSQSRLFIFSWNFKLLSY